MKQRRIVERKAGARAHHAVDGFVRAIVRHEYIVHHDVVAARRAQAQHVPILFDGVIAFRQQEGAVLRRFTFLRRRHQRAEKDPFAQFAAAGKLPVPGQPEAAFNGRHPAHRHIGRRNQRALILAPHVLLCAFVEQRQLPVVHTDHAVHPRGRHTAARHGHLNLEEGLRIEFIAAVTLRLKHLEKAGGLKIGHRFSGNPAIRLGLRGAPGEYRRERFGAGDQFGCKGFRIVVAMHGCLHDGA